jgi:cytochrome P450
MKVTVAISGIRVLTRVFKYLCKNPSIKSRIIDQLDDMFPDNPVADSPLPFSQLNKLSLLEATETECLRMHPPIGYSMPRMTPPSGAVICGVYVPGGVDVGVPAATIGRHPDVYPFPHTWNPDRWLDEKADLATMKLCFLGFGFGSRQCIGRNVANQFIMKMMATILLRYNVELENPKLVLGTKEFTIIKPDQTYNVVLKMRKK